MSQRKATPRGQMTRGANSGPAVILMPPEIRSTFMPNPPLEPLPPPDNNKRNNKKQKLKWDGISQYMVHFEKDAPPPRKILPTPKSIKKKRQEQKLQYHLQEKLLPEIEVYRQQQKECSGEYNGMNCYNTLFIGRLAYEVTERQLLREMENYGPIKDLRLVRVRKNKDDEHGSSTNTTNISRGYAFVEYEHEEDMKRAYRGSDGMKLEGRHIVVDVERGHTVPTWLPRRLGGGLGGTRLGSRNKNITRPGRYDPNNTATARGDVQQQPMADGGGGGGPPPPQMMGGSGGMGRGGGPPPPPSSYYGNNPNAGGGPPPPSAYGGGGGMGRGGGGGGDYGGGGRYGGGGQQPQPLPPAARGGGGDYDPRDRDRGGDRGDRRYSGGGGEYHSHHRHHHSSSGHKRHRSRSPDNRRYGSGSGGSGSSRRRY